MGFEPTRAEPNGLAVHRLNHSATSSPRSKDRLEQKTTYRLMQCLLEHFKLVRFRMEMKSANSRDISCAISKLFSPKRSSFNQLWIVEPNVKRIIESVTPFLCKGETCENLS